MNKCRNPQHPHCTVWVMPGDAACPHGHPQPPEPAAPEPILPRPPLPGLAPRPHLHVSGFDPRAAGGRQALKLELRGMPMDAAPQLAMLAQSALPLHGGERHEFTRTLRGDWRPLFIEFSSRGVEHGQHRIELELHSRHERVPGSARTWVCTLVVNVPRPDATLADLQQAFLATHRNLRVIADDGSIARVNAQASGRLDIEVNARDASIAQLNLDGEPGKVDVGLATIAWDEDLIEVDTTGQAGPHPYPASAACLVSAVPGIPRHVRLFALDEVVLGRYEEHEPDADLLLCHFGVEGPDRCGLTRRLSARHAVIRRGRDGYQVEDVSRYGLLVDGAWPGKHVPVALRLGMRIELTASIRGVVVLMVTGLLPNGVILHRMDEGADAECFCLLEARRSPGETAGQAMPQARMLPVLFHRDGGFWHLDSMTGHETALTPVVPVDRLCALPGPLRFAAGPYPEGWAERAADGDRRRTSPLDRRTGG